MDYFLVRMLPTPVARNILAKLIITEIVVIHMNLNRCILKEMVYEYDTVLTKKSN